MDKIAILMDISSGLVDKIGTLMDIPVLVDKLWDLVDKISGLVDKIAILVDITACLVDKIGTLMDILVLVDKTWDLVDKIDFLMDIPVLGVTTNSGFSGPITPLVDIPFKWIKLAISLCYENWLNIC